MLHKIAPNATIVGIDHLQGLADLARTNLDKDGVKHGPSEKVEIVCGDGRAGWAAKGMRERLWESRLRLGPQGFSALTNDSSISGDSRRRSRSNDAGRVGRAARRPRAYVHPHRRRGSG